MQVKMLTTWLLLGCLAVLNAAPFGQLQGRGPHDGPLPGPGPHPGPRDGEAPEGFTRDPDVHEWTGQHVTWAQVPDTDNDTRPQRDGPQEGRQGNDRRHVRAAAVPPPQGAPVPPAQGAMKGQRSDMFPGQDITFEPKEFTGKPNFFGKFPSDGKQMIAGEGERFPIRDFTGTYRPKDFTFHARDFTGKPNFSDRPLMDVGRKPGPGHEMFEGKDFTGTFKPKDFTFVAKDFTGKPGNFPMGGKINGEKPIGEGFHP